jgi:hypothetical protein
MLDPCEHALVVKALRDGLGGCVEWHEKGANLVRGDPDLQGLTPEFLKKELIHHVRINPDAVVVQVKEERDHWKDHYRFYYKVVLPLQGFPHGIFVEMRLTGDDDPDFPEVTIVRALPQRR